MPQVRCALRVSDMFLYTVLLIVLMMFFLLYADNLSLVFLSAAVLMLPVFYSMLIYTRKRIRIISCGERIKCIKGSKAEIAFRVENNSSLPVSAVKMIFKVRYVPGGEDKFYYVSVPLPAKTSQTVSVKADSAVCGRMECSISSVKICDCLHIFGIGMHEAEDLKVYADFLPDGSLRLSPETEEMLSVKESIGGEADFTSNISQELDELRPYSDGDRLNRVAWKLSGRNGSDDLIVRDSSVRRESVYLLVMDIDSAKGDLNETDRLYELFADAAEVMYSHEISFDSVKADGDILKNVSAGDKSEECIGSVYGDFAGIDSICRNIANRRYDKIILAAAGDSSHTAEKLTEAYGAREALILK